MTSEWRAGKSFLRVRHDFGLVLRAGKSFLRARHGFGPKSGPLAFFFFLDPRHGLRLVLRVGLFFFPAGNID